MADTFEDEALLKFYDSARQEMMSRISLRENSLMFYLGAVGALIAGAIQAKEPLFFLIIPYLSFGMSLVMVHHNSIIAAIILYCTEELDQKLKEKKVQVAQWDNSAARLSSSRSTKHYRFWGDMGIILGPSLFAIVYNWRLFNGGIKEQMAIVFSSLFVILSVVFLSKTLAMRNKVFRKLSKDKK